jgi:pimeloyl-ACP methyl ester carboxylesterase
LTDHVFAVPLDHSRPDGEQIEVFAREVVAADMAEADLPWLLFLQGGPGFASPRPDGRDSWLDRALDDYRVLLLDQRNRRPSSRWPARSPAQLRLLTCPGPVRRTRRQRQSRKD